MIRTPAWVTILWIYSLPSILTAIIPGYLGPSMQMTSDFLSILPPIMALILVTGHYKVHAARSEPLDEKQRSTLINKIIILGTVHCFEFFILNCDPWVQVQWYRLALSIGPNRTVTPPLHNLRKNSQFPERCVSKNSRRWTRSKIRRRVSK
jgi:hypothetical protein